MRRRDFIAAMGGAAAWPLTVQAQQRALPVIGYLGISDADDEYPWVTAFIKGLNEAGYIQGRNVSIEYRWARNDAHRLPELAADLVRRHVAVITAPGSNAAALAAKAATSTIPIVFSIGGDPVKLGLVASLNRPGGNITGVSFLATDTAAKMLEVLHELVPDTFIAALLNPTNPASEADTTELQRAARVLSLEIHVLKATTASDIDIAFAALAQQRSAALLIEGDALFNAHRQELAVWTAAHRIPAIFQQRTFPDAGGLMSYGANLAEATRINGVYVGRILKGEAPADLPVQLSTRIEMVLNLKTAKALGIEVPTATLLRATEVIE